MNTPTTKAQKAFETAVKKLEKMYQLDNRSLCRHYHDSKSVSVDGELHAIMNGMSDHLGHAWSIIEEAVGNAGYFIENVNGCDWNFYRNEVN